MARARQELDAAKAAPHSDVYHAILRHVFFPSHPYMPTLRTIASFKNLWLHHQAVSGNRWLQTLRSRTSWLLHPQEVRVLAQMRKT